MNKFQKWLCLMSATAFVTTLFNVPVVEWSKGKILPYSLERASLWDMSASQMVRFDIISIEWAAILVLSVVGWLLLNGNKSPDVQGVPIPQTPSTRYRKGWVIGIALLVLLAIGVSIFNLQQEPPPNKADIFDKLAYQPPSTNSPAALPPGYVLESTPPVKKATAVPKVGIDYFTKGSSSKEVLSVMGTPSSMQGFGEMEVWGYGQDQVTLVKGTVASWSNYGNRLKIKLAYSP